MKNRNYLLLATLLLLLATTASNAQIPCPAFDLSKIDSQIILRFEEAWRFSGNGLLAVEGVVLIYMNTDGSYRAVTLGRTNQSKTATFRWDPDIIAIVHTHPRANNPQPGRQDLALADRFCVPIFTITLEGMFMYDPRKKEIVRVKDLLDWLDPSSWAPPEQVATKTNKE